MKFHVLCFQENCQEGNSKYLSAYDKNTEKNFNQFSTFQLNETFDASVDEDVKLILKEALY